MSAQCASRCRAVVASSTRTSPVSDSRRPATIRRRVVLPPPLGPTNPTLDWRGTTRLMPVRATTSPKAFPASRSSIAKALAVPATGVSSPYAGITRSGSDGRWRGPCGQPPSQPGQPELPCGCGPMLPPEAASMAGACSTTWCSTKGWPTSGELLAKVCQARQEPDQRSWARAPTRGRNRMAIRCGTGGHAEPPGPAPERRPLRRRDPDRRPRRRPPTLAGERRAAP